MTPTHRVALEKASFVVGAQKGLTVVFGETGMGKSSLARLLHEKFVEESKFISTLITHPRYPTPYALLRTIAQEMGAPIAHKSYKDTLDALKAYLIRTSASPGQDRRAHY